VHARPRRFMGIGLLAVGALALLGCASTQPASHAANGVAAGRKTAALPGKPGCFWLRDFQGSWTVLNDSELIVYVPLYSQPYLIKLFEPVPDLEFDQRLGFADVERTGMICDSSMDDLVVPHWQPHRIPIVAVRELTAQEARHLLVVNHIRLPPATKPAKGNQVSSGKQ